MANGQYRIDIFLNGSGATNASNVQNGRNQTGVAQSAAISGVNAAIGSTVGKIGDIPITVPGTTPGTGILGGILAGKRQAREARLSGEAMISAMQRGQAGEADLANKAEIANITASEQSFRNAETAAKLLGKYVTVRTASYLSNRVSLWTGDSVTQDRLNNVMKLGLAAYVAISTKNPALAAVGLGLEGAFHTIDYHQKRRWDSMYEQEGQRRSGLARYHDRGAK